MRKSFIVLFLLFCCMVFPQKLYVAFGENKPPFVLPNSIDGIEYRLIDKIFSNLGWKFVTKQFKPKQLQLSPLKSKMDVAVGVNFIKDDGLFYSDEFYSFFDVVISKKSKNYSIKTIQDMAPYRIGAFSKASLVLGDEFSALVKGKNRKDYHEYPDQRIQAEAFWKDNLDLVIAAKSIFLWNSKFLDKSVPTNEELTLHNVFNKKGPVYVSFKNKELCEKFNAELARIKASGEYQKITDSLLK